VLFSQTFRVHSCFGHCVYFEKESLRERCDFCHRDFYDSTLNCIKANEIIFLKIRNLWQCSKKDLKAMRFSI